MNTLASLSNLILDCVIAAAAVALLYRLGRWLWDAASTRWTAPPAPYDPVSVDVWHVLADARAITEAAAKEEPYATE